MPLGLIGGPGLLLRNLRDEIEVVERGRLRRRWCPALLGRVPRIASVAGRVVAAVCGRRARFRIG